MYKENQKYMKFESQKACMCAFMLYTTHTRVRTRTLNLFLETIPDMLEIV